MNPDEDDPRPRIITAAQVRELLTWPELIAACRQALIGLATPGRTPAGSSTQVAVPGGALHLKAGALLAPPVLSVKANLRPDGGGSAGAIMAFDHRQQRLAAIVASGDLTAMRTGAIAAVAAQCLYPGRQPVLALVGAGPVARMTLRALHHVLQPADVRIWSRDREHAIRLPGQEGGSHKQSVAAATYGADLVVTCTPAREPLLLRGDLQDDAVVLAMGADSPGKRELGAGVLDGARVVADSVPDALTVGECAYLATDPTGVRPLGELLVDPSDRTALYLTIFDSVGSSAVDAAAVALVLDRASRADVGVRFDLDPPRRPTRCS